MKPHAVTFSIVVGLFQIALLVLFAVSVDYDYNVNNKNGTQNEIDVKLDVVTHYTFFQDVNVMIFIGFGFLMVFLKKYGFSSVGYTLFLGCVLLQWATLLNGWIFNEFDDEESPFKIGVNVKTMITSNFAVAAVLISFGAIIGKASRLQIFIMGVVELIFYAVNENILVHRLHITDVGGSMVIHMFGAYFGLAVTKVIYREQHGEENEKEGSVYHSDIMAMIGTVFLWIYWPSFNGAMLGPGTQQQRAVINTYFSLAACAVTTFVVSPLTHKKNKIDIVHIQNATIAGGVAVGTCADLMIKPWGAILIGMLGGLISTLGYAYVTPFLASKLKIHDTCGVHNLHGMPAIVAAISGAVTAAVADKEDYGTELTSIWGEMGKGRSAEKQGGFQAAAMFVTLAMAIGGGIFTGLIIRWIGAPEYDELYDDGPYWIVPVEEVREDTTEMKKVEKV